VYDRIRRVAGGGDQVVIGIDVGGTKVAAAHVSGREATCAVERPTDVSSGAAVVNGIAVAIEAVAAQSGPPAALGVGLPSQIDHASGEVLGSVNIPLGGIALGRELEGRFGVPAFVDNDANVAALAEAYFVDGGPASHLVMYTLGTGVGGGVVIDGRIFRGASGLGAELGHVVVEADGPRCQGTCPNYGCLETLCSGTALARDANELARDDPESALGRVLAENGKVTARDAVEAADAGDPAARSLFDRLGRHLGIGLSGAMNTFEPEHIVIGGGLSAASHLFFDRAVEEARSRALPALADRVKISLAQAGADAGVLGAGLLAVQEMGAGKGHTPGHTAREGVR
jgi:glucokinase